MSDFITSCGFILQSFQNGSHEIWTDDKGRHIELCHRKKKTTYSKRGVIIILRKAGSTREKFMRWRTSSKKTESLNTPDQ